MSGEIHFGRDIVLGSSMQFADSYSDDRIEGIFKRSNQASTPDYGVLADGSSIPHSSTNI
jgi:hypothetical protein